MTPLTAVRAVDLSDIYDLMWKGVLPGKRFPLVDSKGRTERDANRDPECCCSMGHRDGGPFLARVYKDPTTLTWGFFCATCAST